MPKVVLVAAILLAPVVLWLLTGVKSDTVVLLMALASMPVLIGLISQRLKGRTGAVWSFLSLEVIFSIFLFFVAFLSGLIDPGQKPLLVGVSGVILFGLLPLLVIVATGSRRKLVQQFESILGPPSHRPH
jgi:hypothetical protein